MLGFAGPLRIVSALVVLFLSGTFVAAQEPTVSRPPNLVFILADDLGPGHLGCYGQTKIRTPRIDRLAAEGMRFLQAYAGSCVCAPSRSTLMTGLHTGHTPIRANQGGAALADSDVTIAEVLTASGYVTGLFGKWGLGTEGTSGHPNRQGFQHFFGYLHQVHAHFFYPYYLWRNETRFPLPENEGKKQVRYSHDEIQREALAFIRAQKDRPFFCYIAYTVPHVELVVPEDSRAPYRGQFPEVPLPDPRMGYLGADEPLATFAGMVSRLDRSVGEIVDLLQELGIADNTLVIFTSDNGPQGNAWQRVCDYFDGNGPLRGYKTTFYEGGVRTPFVARWPGHVPAGTTTDHVCAFWDWFPTAAELARAKTEAKVDGISFVPTLLGSEAAGRPQQDHEFLYWEMQFGAELGQAIRMGRWKALRMRPDAPWELYDLSRDPGETQNMASVAAEIVQRIDDHARSARTEARVFPNGPATKFSDYVK